MMLDAINIKPNSPDPQKMLARSFLEAAQQQSANPRAIPLEFWPN